MTHSEHVDKVIETKNFNSRKETPINCLVIHCTEAPYDEAVRIFANEGVSAHYIVDVNGEITSMVEEENRAWHAGVSEWRDVYSLNSSSIGVEVIGYDYLSYPDYQIECVKKLCKDIVHRYNISNQNIVSHSDIGTIIEVVGENTDNDAFPKTYALRKTDPGRYFPWDKLADDGLGNKLHPLPDQVENSNEVLYKLNDSGVDILRLKDQLHEYGYQIKDEFHNDLYDTYFSKVVHQFKLHFVPEQSFNNDLPDENWTRLAQNRLDYLTGGEICL